MLVISEKQFQVTTMKRKIQSRKTQLKQQKFDDQTVKWTIPALAKVSVHIKDLEYWYDICT